MVVLLIRVTVQIKGVTESARRTAENIEGIVGSAGKFAGPGMIARTLFKQAKKFKKGKK